MCKDNGPETVPATAIGTCSNWRTIGISKNSNGPIQVCDNGFDYMVRSPGANFTFNICGNTTAVCAFSPDSPLYDSRGVAVQQFGPRPSGTDPTICTDWDTGLTIPCTEQCAVVGTPYLQFNLLNLNNPTGGLVIRHDAMPPNSLDPFGECAPGENGLLRERSVQFVIACDPGAGTMQYDTSAASPDPSENNGLVLYEYPQCSYTIFLRSSTACGQKGDPFAPQGPYGPGTNFGFTVLGAALTIFVSFTYSFGDNRGWWDPIKNRLPSIPGMGSYGSSYKPYGSGSSSMGGAGATPITASAYGT